MRPHDDAVAKLLREDPAFADEYLSAALDEADQPGGREALLAALRHIAEAQAYRVKACTVHYRPKATRPLNPCWP